MADLFVSTLIQGLIYALVSFGVYITYSILDFPDLGVDGTFPLGAAVTALLLIKGVDPWLTLVISLLVGALAGLFTGVVHVRLKVRDLLAGPICRWSGRWTPFSPRLPPWPFWAGSPSPAGSW